MCLYEVAGLGMIFRLAGATNSGAECLLGRSAVVCHPIRITKTTALFR